VDAEACIVTKVAPPADSDCIGVTPSESRIPLVGSSLLLLLSYLSPIGTPIRL
jgi:hypothetical protein